jgi:hypothetical protein
MDKKLAYFLIFMSSICFVGLVIWFFEMIKQVQESFLQIFVFGFICSILILSWYLSRFLQSKNIPLFSKFLDFFTKNLEKYTYFFITLVFVTFFLCFLLMYIYVFYGIFYNGLFFSSSSEGLIEIFLDILTAFIIKYYEMSIFFIGFLFSFVFIIWFVLLNEFVQINKIFFFLFIFCLVLFYLYYFHLLTEYYNIKFFDFAYAMKNSEGDIIESIDLNSLKTASKTSSQNVDPLLVDKVINSKSGIVYSNNNCQIGICFESKDDVQLFYKDRNWGYGVKPMLNSFVNHDPYYDILVNKLNQNRYCVFFKDLK